MKILGIGEIVLDKIYNLPHNIIEWQKIQSQWNTISVGGPVPAALKLLKNLWYDVTFIWSIWDNINGKYIRAYLNSYQIATEFIYDNDTKSNTILINQQNGARTIIRDVNKNSLIEKIPLKLIIEADAIIFDRHEPKAFDFVMEHKKEDTIIVFDPSTEWSDKIIHMAKNIDYPIFPIETFEKLLEGASLEEQCKEMYKLLGKTFVITDGSKWSYTYDGKEIIKTPVIDIKPVDSNGAGDVFRGGFMYGLLQWWELQKIMKFANVVAGLQCKREGNLTAIPAEEEIFDIL